MAREIVPKRKIRYPMGLERDYAKLLTAYVARKVKVASAFIPEMKAALQSSNTTGHINLVIDQMAQAMESPDVLTGTMQKMARLVETHTEKETDAEFRSVFSLSVPLLPGTLKNQPVTDVGRQDAASPDLEELKRAWVDQNLDLIRSIDRETLERIKQRLNDAIIYNSNAAELTRFLTEAIQDIAHNETNRAVLIATDQIGKLHGRMSQYRQEQAGITHYIWETAHDSRVRPWHRTRQGKKFAWNNPPPDGHPGIPIRCRCVALPVIDVDTIPIRTKAGTFISLTAKKLASAPPQGEEEGNANNLYPKTLGGASRGEEMTHAEADSGNVNPRVNFSEAYRNNCQTTKPGAVAMTSSPKGSRPVVRRNGYPARPTWPGWTRKPGKPRRISWIRLYIRRNSWPPGCTAHWTLKGVIPSNLLGKAVAASAILFAFPRIKRETLSCMTPSSTEPIPGIKKYNVISSGCASNGPSTALRFIRRPGSCGSMTRRST